VLFVHRGTVEAQCREGQFVYCGTSGAVYKSMRHSEEEPSKQKEKAYKMKGILFSNL
jgi:hypothetical protein